MPSLDFLKKTNKISSDIINIQHLHLTLLYAPLVQGVVIDKLYIEYLRNKFEGLKALQYLTEKRIYPTSYGTINVDIVELDQCKRLHRWLVDSCYSWLHQEFQNAFFQGVTCDQFKYLHTYNIGDNYSPHFSIQVRKETNPPKESLKKSQIEG